MTIIDDIRHDMKRLVVPRWARRAAPAYRAWMLLAFMFGWFVLRLVLIAVYGTLILPLSIALRLAGRDPLERNISKETDTYWIPVVEKRGNERYVRKF